jgi:dTDP-glucose 4,6-dehydratase
MARTLITGASGFIGSHLVDRYLRLGYRVIGIDNGLTGTRANLAAAEQDELFTLVRSDVCQRGDALIHEVEAIGGPCESILHFASPASPVDYGHHPIETLEVNSAGTELCLRMAKRWGARLVYASTSEVYGDPLQHPQSETYWGNVNPIGPRSCYDEAKRFGEALVTSHRLVYGIDVRIARIFNTYGPRMRLDDGRVVPNFVRQATEGAPLTIYGDGLQTRSFCYVEDLVDGIVRLAEAQPACGRVVNLGNPEEHTIIEFAEIVSRAAGVELRFERQPLPLDDPARRCPDITLARQLLGWEPRISLEEGLRRTIAEMRTRVYAGIEV